LICSSTTYVNLAVAILHGADDEAGLAVVSVQFQQVLTDPGGIGVHFSVVEKLDGQAIRLFQFIQALQFSDMGHADAKVDFRSFHVFQFHCRQGQHEGGVVREFFLFRLRQRKLDELFGVLFVADECLKRPGSRLGASERIQPSHFFFQGLIVGMCRGGGQCQANQPNQEHSQHFPGHGLSPWIRKAMH
jgi:hypothetical protein